MEQFVYNAISLKDADRMQTVYTLIRILIKEHFNLGQHCQFRAEGYKTFFMFNAAEHEILNAHKYENNQEMQLFQTQISLECFFLLINVKMPTFVGILTFMSRKSFILS